VIVRTPLVRAPAFGEDVWIKAELLQRGGSFKLRGVLNKLRGLAEVEVTTVSAGNHARAVALACGARATIFMYRGVDAFKVAATRALGATVDLESETAAEAFARMAAFADETGATVVHPFDDPAIITGAAGVGREIVEDLPDVATVIVPIGGGGLSAGIASVIGDDVRLVCVEPDGAATLTAALAAGKPVAVAPSTAADALAPPSVGEHPFAILRDRAEAVTLTEAELAAGLRAAYADAKLACEVGGAAAIAALVAGRVEPAGPTVLVASGGNIAPTALRALLA
jgi:threonine dehydratase